MSSYLEKETGHTYFTFTFSIIIRNFVFLFIRMFILTINRKAFSDTGRGVHHLHFLVHIDHLQIRVVVFTKGTCAMRHNIIVEECAKNSKKALTVKKPV